MHELQLYDKKHNKSGTLNIITQFIAVANDCEINPDMNSKSYIKLNIQEATFVKDLDMIGK